MTTPEHQFPATLSYQAELVNHYRQVKARLWKPKLPTRLVIPPKPHIPATPAQKPRESMRDSIMTLQDFTVQNLFELVDIMAAVSQVTRIPVSDLTGPRRLRPISEARHLFFWLARNYTTRSRIKIARYCGLNEASSVFHAVKKINEDQPRWQPKIDATLALLGANHG